MGFCLARAGEVARFPGHFYWYGLLMKICTSCGGTDLTRVLIDHKYLAGSVHETILHDIEKFTCANTTCGEYFVHIPSSRTRAIDAAWELANPE